MEVYEAKIAPFINVNFFVTQVFWNNNKHKGIDLATATMLGNVPLYSICDGIVIKNGFEENGWGNYVILKDSSGVGIVYAHMNKKSHLKELDKIKIGQLVGYEGTTGNSTGIHLHLEMQFLKDNKWHYSSNKEDYVNPAEYLGIPNQKGLECYYNGTIIQKSKNNIKWLKSKAKKINIMY